MRLRLPHPAWLALTTIIVTVISLVFHYWWEYRRVQLLVEEVKVMKGEVEIKFRKPTWIPNWVWDPEYERRCPWWKTDLPIVMLSGNEIDDAQLARLERHRIIQGLWIVDSQVTDRGLDSLRSLPELKFVALLDNKKISVPGLRCLLEFPVTVHSPNRACC